MSTQIEHFLLNAIQKNKKLPDNYDIHSFNYITAGYLDSAEIMKFILNIETEFDIEFTDSDIHSPEFRTIGGLIALIKKYNETKSAWSDLKLNKIPRRYYWKFLLKQKNIPKALFFPMEIDSDNQIALFRKYVATINLETSTYCNRKCQYCPTPLSDIRKTQTYMSDKIFTKIVSELSSINYSSTICLNLYNEPLADKNIFLKIKYLRTSLPNALLVFNSNGDYAKPSNLDKLSEMGLNALFITLHPLLNQSYQLEDRINNFKKFFKKLGLNTNQYEITEPLVNEHIESNIDWNGMRIRVMASNLLKYGNSRAGEINFLNAPTKRFTPCLRPLREIFISYNGDVFPCCEIFPDNLDNQKYLISNVSSNTIFEAYTSQALAKWRKHLFTFGEKITPCDGCVDQDYSSVNSEELRKDILNKLDTEENMAMSIID